MVWEVVGTEAIHASRLVELMYGCPNGSSLSIPGRAGRQCLSVCLRKVIRLKTAASTAVLADGMKSIEEVIHIFERTLWMLARSEVESHWP